MWRWRNELGNSQGGFPHARAALRGASEDVMWVIDVAGLNEWRWRVVEHDACYTLEWEDAGLPKHLTYYLEEYR